MLVGYEYKLDRFRGINKKKLAVAALFVGFVLLGILVVIGVVIMAILSTLLGQTDSGIGQSISNVIKTIWTYVTDFINALWKQVIANPLQFLIGGNK